jgi:hypothetical protein
VGATAQDSSKQVEFLLCGITKEFLFPKNQDLHPGEDNTRKMAAALGWTITRGSLKPCDDCATGKAKQKNVPKVSKHLEATEDEPRVFLDITTVKSPKGGPNVTKPNWRILVDERTQLKFLDFYDAKNGMVEPTCERFQRWKDAGKEVRYL